MDACHLIALEGAARAAQGRKEMRCQFGMADIYKAAELMPPGVEIPNGDRDWSRAQGRSLIIAWLENHPELFQVRESGLPEAGDLLVFKLGHVPHHVAILLAGGRLVHVFGEHGVQIAPCIPAPWAKRLHSAWSLVR